MSYESQKGFSIIIGVLVLITIASTGLTAWYIWHHNDSSGRIMTTPQNQTKPIGQAHSVETETWTLITTQDKAFSMRIPRGWSITKYPGNFLGSMKVAYEVGQPPKVETSDTDYVGHMLRFRANITRASNTELTPQWSSPQAGLEESAQDFSIGSLQGKRFKAVFSLDLDQTLYEYVFNLKSNRKLDIVYTVYHDQNEIDDVETVERAIKTIRLDDQTEEL